MANVVLTPDAREQLLKLPKTIRKRIEKVLTRLKGWPDVSGAKRLSGDLADWHRMRTGDYRLRFRLIKGEVVIDKIGLRRDFYDG